MARITLVQYPGLGRRSTLSPPCGKVHMALHFKNLPYDVRNVRAPWEARRFNPRGRVPVLLLDGETVVDSTDILDALERTHPDPPLDPRERTARATARMLEDWADEVLYFYCVFLRWVPQASFARMKHAVLDRMPVPLRWIAPTIARREVARRVQGQGVGLKGETVVRRELDGALDTLVDLLGDRPYLVGEAISRADLAVVAVLDQLRVRELTPEAATAIEERAPLARWIERVHGRTPDAARLGNR